MKRLKVIASSLLLGVLLFVLAACSGASGAVSGFVNAEKKGDSNQAMVYVVGGKYDEASEAESSDNVYVYIYEKVAKSFSYKVEESTENEVKEGKNPTTTVKISYTGYSGTKVVAEYVKRSTAAVFGADGKSGKALVDEILKEMKKDDKKSTISVTVEKTEDGWKLQAVSAAALSVAIYA